jgi:hypothetical protein
MMMEKISRVVSDTNDSSQSRMSPRKLENKLNTTRHMGGIRTGQMVSVLFFLNDHFFFLGGSPKEHPTKQVHPMDIR